MTLREIIIKTEGIETRLIMDAAMEADFRSLQAHPGWKRYAAVLKAQKTQVFESLMSAKNDEYAKRIGIAEGLSLSVNTIEHLVRSYEKKDHDKLVAAESKKQSPPKG